MPLPVWRIGVLVCTVSVGAACAPPRDHEAGFRFPAETMTLSPAATTLLGGPIDKEEASRIQRLARRELEQAFAGMPIRITARADAFWRVSVSALLPTRRRSPFPAAGETWPMGRFGGVSHVSFRVLAHAALRYAPAGASRDEILLGVARGVGRTAAHELAHAILGPSPTMDGRDDEESYEFHSFARAAHYYGELHWNDARPALIARLGGGP
ncbi:MAG: proteasome assembly chaperone 4 family protein [Vicinamibacterales bacterium]